MQFLAVLDSSRWCSTVATSPRCRWQLRSRTLKIIRASALDTCHIVATDGYRNALEMHAVHAKSKAKGWCARCWTPSTPPGPVDVTSV